MKTRRSKACDISQKVKQRVWERDNGCCVICGNNYNVMPNAHYIPRSKGGLGIEENVFKIICSSVVSICISDSGFWGSF